MANPTITIKHDGKVAVTTLEDMKNMADELTGMPDPLPHLVEKITGTLSEGYSDKLPDIGDRVDLELTVKVKSITEKKNNENEEEFIVLFEVVGVA